MKSNFFEKYQNSIPKGLPKYAELREVIRSAVLDGYWKNGEKLPNERKIADITPFSLGTVQKAFKDLVAEGIVDRRQGHGSFVSDNEAKMADPWHFRFSKNLFQNYMEVYPKIRKKEKVSKKNSWAKLLNSDDGCLIQIDRIIAIKDKFMIYSEFFLSAKKYKSFLKKSDKELTSVNFKTILHQEYNVSFKNISQAVQMIKFSKVICEELNLEKGTVGLLMEIIAYSTQKNPVYYQKIYIPPNDFKLITTDSLNVPETWR